MKRNDDIYNGYIMAWQGSCTQELYVLGLRDILGAVGEGLTDVHSQTIL